ncbi:hypothetical protein CASFOL_017661 [Castilleja foliolosa]|uniref:Uncharacterized protein n=1 Tax=Castilleja foliolosa TaxID=1961234 RepID=A0ABD3DBL8_9LAMI
MIAPFIIFYLLTSFEIQFTESKLADFNGRRILHQPLFPANYAPPSPPPPETPDYQVEGMPFSNEFPTGPPTTPYQSPPQPPPSTIVDPAMVTGPVSTQPKPNPAKKVAIAVASAILILGMLSAMAFYLYKHRQTRSSDDAHNLFEDESFYKKMGDPGWVIRIRTIRKIKSRTRRRISCLARPILVSRRAQMVRGDRQSGPS